VHIPFDLHRIAKLGELDVGDVLKATACFLEFDDVNVVRPFAQAGNHLRELLRDTPL
jgi:hypothetical protein